MENPDNSGSIYRDQKYAKSPETKLASRARQCTKLSDVLKSDKPVKTKLSYADFHHEITRDPDVNLPKYLGTQQSRVLDSRVSKEDELVRYMSNIPRYLEKGNNYQDKALNVGVLDWRRLENWRCSQKQVPGQQSGCSPSSSTSSLSSTDGSSAHSIRGLSCSPARQRVHRLSTQSTSEDSPKEAHVRDVPARQRMVPPAAQFNPLKVPPGGRTSNIPQKFQDSPVSTGNYLRRQQWVSGAVQCERKEPDLKSAAEMGKRQTLDKYEVGAPWKGKLKAQGVELTKEDTRSPEMKLTAGNKDFAVIPRDLSKHKCSSLTAISSFTVDGRLSVDPCQKSILGKNNFETDIPLKHNHRKKQLEPSEPSSQCANVGKSSSQHSNKSLHPTTIVRNSCKNDAQGIRGAPRRSHVSPYPASIHSSPYKSRASEENRPHTGTRSDIAVQASEELVAVQHSNKPLHPTTTAQNSCKNDAQKITGAPRRSHVSPYPASIHSSPSKSRASEEDRPHTGRRSDIAVQASEELVAVHHSNKPLHPTTTIRNSCKNDAQGIRGALRRSLVSPYPASIHSSPSKSQAAEENRPHIGPRSDVTVHASEELVARRSASVPKTRNQSPIRRLGSAMGKMIKNAGSRDNSPVHRSSSQDCVVAKSGSGVVSSVSTDSPYCDKLSTNNYRGKSSPIRRLLDPLLKPKAANCSEPSKKLSSSVVGTINSSNEPLDLCVGHSAKVDMRRASDCTTLLQAQAQALLHVSFKYGIPLFTFVIDNESNILAATVRKSNVPGKGHHSWTYTFFTIREVKRKSGIWSSHGGKGDGHGYVPNVLAQMKVSDSPNSFTMSDNADDNITREYDLFAVDGDQSANEFHPTNELAAIVVKLSRSTAEDSAEEQIKSQRFSSTVILPGGVHTVPSKGELSTLAERWRSGGVCDCGGWDLGCQLRVYTNEKEHGTRSSSRGTLLSKDKFQLFSQGNQDGLSILSMAPFKERVYSVEFSPSLSLLQAFAICMSFIDCRRSLDHPEPGISIDKITEACGFDVAT